MASVKNNITKKVCEERIAVSKKIAEERAERTRKISRGWDVLKKRSITEVVRILKGKYLCIVTGAGNGLGRAIANLVFQESGIYPFALGGSKLILIDKDMESLKETSGKKMKQFLKHRKIEVELICADLGDLNETKETMKELLETQDRDFEQTILINNITTLADTRKSFAEYFEYSQLQQYFNLNIISKIFLTTTFCNGFPRAKSTIVNTINFDASNPNVYLGLPYMASAAIESFSEVFAKENPPVKVLIFKPNRVDSNSTNEILENCLNNELKEEIRKARDLSKLCLPLDTAKKLSKVLEDNEFIPGELLKWSEEED